MENKYCIGAPIWCNMVQNLVKAPMTQGKRKKDGKPKTERVSSLRVSIGFPPNLYRSLEEIAREKKVSLAWVVREAAEKYVEDRWPLFGKH